MQIAFLLLIVWLFITVIGHGSWLAISAFSRAIFGNPSQPSRPTLHGSEREGLAVVRRYAARFRAASMISVELVDELVTCVDQWEKQLRQPTKESFRNHRVATLHHQQPNPRPQALAQTEENGHYIATAVESTLPAKADAGETNRASFVAKTADESTERSAIEPSATEPRTSASELITRFLADHNIRWGELLAGVLIVVSSIGLVVSLWNTLIQTHPAIPSIVLLSANAIVFFFGIYTLTRWKLRHTSRAILVIAMLLSPLSVLAGLATSRIGQTTDSILAQAAGQQPVFSHSLDLLSTISIFIATAGFAWLIKKAANALVGRTEAWSLTVLVLVPIVCLPACHQVVGHQIAGHLLAGRLLNTGLGQQWNWLPLAASCFAYGHWIWRECARSKRHRLRLTSVTKRTLLPAAAKNRVLMVAMGSFAHLALCCYVGFVLRHQERSTVLPILISGTPMFITIAYFAVDIVRRTQRVGIAIFAKSLAAVSVGYCFLLQLACAGDMESMWIQTTVFTVLAIWISSTGKQRFWPAIATVPVGLSATWSAPMLFSTAGDTLNGTSGTVNGYSMLACGFFATTLWLTDRWHSNPLKQQKQAANETFFAGVVLEQPMRIAAIGWTVAAVGIAAALAFSPDKMIHPLHPLMLGGALAAIAFAIKLRFKPGKTVDVASLTIMCIGSLAAMRPLVVGSALASFPDERWLMVLLSVSAGSLALDLADTLSVFPRLPFAFLRRRLPTNQSTSLSETKSPILAWASVASAVMAGGGACMMIPLAPENPLSEPILLTSFPVVESLLLTTVALHRSRHVLAIAQLTSISIAATVCCKLFPQLWTDRTLFEQGDGFWHWILLACAITFSWRIIQKLFRLAGLNPTVESSSYPSTWLEAIAMTFTGLACLVSWLPMVAEVLGTAAPHSILLNTGSLSTKSLIVLGMTGAVAYVSLRRNAMPATSNSTGSVGIWYPTIWLSSVTLIVIATICDACISHPETKLLFATSSLLAVQILIRLASRTNLKWNEAITASTHSLTCLSVLACGLSATLLLPNHWLGITDPTSTLAVAAPLTTAAWLLVWSATCWAEHQRAPRNHWLNGSVIGWILAATVITPVLTVKTTGTVDPIDLINVLGISIPTWLMLTTWLKQRFFLSDDQRLNQVLVTAVVVIGWANAAAASIGLFADIPWQPRPLSFVSTAAGLAFTSRFLKTTVGARARIPRSLVLAAIAGHLGWLIQLFPLDPRLSGQDIAVLTWTFAAIIGWYGGVRKAYRNKADTAMAITITVAVPTIVFTINPSMASAICSGVCALLAGWIGTTVSRKSHSKPWLLWIIRGINIYTLFFAVHWIDQGLSNIASLRFHGEARWSIILAVIAGYSCVLRLFSPRRDANTKTPDAVPITELAAIVSLAMVAELVYSLFADPSDYEILWLSLRLFAYVTAGIGSLFKSRLGYALTATGTLVALPTFATVLAACFYGSDFEARVTTLCLSSSVIMALTACVIPWPLRWATNSVWLSNIDRSILTRLTTALARLACFSGLAFALTATSWILQASPTQATVFTTLSLGTTCFTIARLANLLDRTRLRFVALYAGLATIVLLSSLSPTQSNHLLLEYSMRWLVAAVFSSVALIGFPPSVLSSHSLRSWRPVISRGRWISGSAAIASLALMMSCELVARGKEGIESLPLTLVMGVAVTIGFASLLAAWVAFRSGPIRTARTIADWQQNLRQLEDRTRVILIIAAQALAGTSWIHVLICKPHWTMIGLRQFWPFFVLAIAMLSTAITHWASKRGDRLLFATLQRTSLYLPLIPVVGFWLSGRFSESSWSFNDAGVPYALLLGLVAVYYVSVSILWKSSYAKLAALIIGNMAVWVTLMQQPGLGFLVHPQLWLIPPAVGTLLVTHLHRQQLPDHLVASIRYACTLVIYISSSADMIINSIGQTLLGPIILIVLSMMGMAIGIALRIRPFLYIGAMFVVLGMTSMVWHAGRSLDAVWPWWVFGIGTGTAILLCLTAIEKNKPQLRRYTRELSTWQ